MGNTLVASVDSADPDGNDAFTYSWQTSTDGNTWSSVGTNSASYQVGPGDQNKQLRLVVAYTDGEGFSESVTTTAGLVAPFNTGNGKAGLITSTDHDEIAQGIQLQDTTGLFLDNRVYTGNDPEFSPYFSNYNEVYGPSLLNGWQVKIEHDKKIIIITTSISAEFQGAGGNGVDPLVTRTIYQGIFNVDTNGLISGQLFSISSWGVFPKRTWNGTEFLNNEEGWAASVEYPISFGPMPLMGINNTPNLDLYDLIIDGSYSGETLSYNETTSIPASQPRASSKDEFSVFNILQYIPAGWELNPFISDLISIERLEEGDTLVAPLVKNDPDGDSIEPNYTYQWFLNGSPIVGAINSTHSTGPSGFGIYKVAITYTDTEGNTATVESSEQAVYKIDNGQSTAGEISSTTPGILQEGFTLIAPPITSDPDGDAVIPSYAYEWFKNGLAIPDATLNSYLVPAGGAGSYTASITYTDNQQHTITVSSPRSTVYPALDYGFTLPYEDMEYGSYSRAIYQASIDPSFSISIFLNGVE